MVETSVTVKSGASSRASEQTVEEVAMLGLQLKRDQDKRSPISRLIYEAETNYSTITERMRFMEVMTNQAWYSAKYNTWLEKVFSS